MSAREIVIRLVFSTVSTVGLSILFYIRPRRLPLATLGGFLTYAVYLLVHTVLASEFVCNMLASLAGALYAELLARRTRVPVTVYTIPCVIPLVPGSVLYRTMSSLVQHGLIRRGRVFTFSVLLPDQPGELLKVAKIVSEQQGNIIKLEHNQFVSINRSAAVELRITLEAFGTEHKNEIIAALEKEGYQPKVVRANI